MTGTPSADHRPRHHRDHPDHRAAGVRTSGDDVAAAILHAAQLHDHDIVVITSKVFSRPRAGWSPRRPTRNSVTRCVGALSRTNRVRVVARKNRTLITENRYGLIQAAAGVDGSNVATDELALLPRDPDASAARTRAAFAAAGIDAAVVITDTMGRAWRIGQTDVAIGAAGLRSPTPTRAVVTPTATS